MLQQVIINILVKTYNFSYAEAYKKWYKAQVTGNDQVVYDIIDGLIKDNPDGGIPFFINRNPKLKYAILHSIMWGLYSKECGEKLVNCWKLVKPSCL